VRVRIRGLKWTLWDVNRAAETFPSSGNAGAHGRVGIEMKGCAHCESRVSYRRMKIWGLLIRGRKLHRTITLPCPAPDPDYS
jgi:hypothetical protein